jgi:Bacterial membrane protein YfhO
VPEKPNRFFQPETLVCSLILIGLLNIVFFPVIWGDKTLISSAGDAAAIMPYGAYEHNKELRQSRRSNDDGAPAWFSEPSYALLHAEYFSSGVPPLWNPYNGFGAPLLANMQSQPFNPLILIACLNPSPKSDDLFVLARLLLAGILTNLYLRRFTGIFGATFGAIAFMLTGYMVIFINMPEISVSMWMPGLFLALELLAQNVNFNRIVLTGFFSAMMLLGGMPEVSFLELFAGGCYFLARVLTTHGAWTVRMKRFVAFALSCGIGLALAAPQILPFIEYIRESSNAHSVNIGAGGAAGPGSVYHQNFPAHFLNYLTPLIYGQLGDAKVKPGFGYDGFNGYWGVMVFAFAISAVVSAIASLRKKKKESTVSKVVPVTFFFAGLAVVLIGKKFGMPLLSWIAALPLFKLVIFWKYSEPIIGFAMAVLAGIGFDALATGKLTKRHVITGFSIAAGLLLSIALYDKRFIWGDHVVHVLFDNVLTISLSLIVLTAVIAILALHKPESRAKSCRLITLLLCADLTMCFLLPTFYWFHQLANQQANPYQGAPFITFLKAQTNQSERILGFDGILFPNWSSAFQLRDIRNLDAMYPAQYLTFVRNFVTDNEPTELSDSNLTTRFHGMEKFVDPTIAGNDVASITRLLYLSSVRYLLSTRSLHPESKETMVQPVSKDRVAYPISKDTAAYSVSQNIVTTYPQLIYDKEIKIFKTAEVIPRASLFYDFTVAKNDREALALLKSKDFDIKSKVVLAADKFEQLTLPPAHPQQQSQPQNILQDAPLMVRIGVQAKHDGILMLNDQYYPGWNVFVDGKQSDLLRADYIFRAVLVKEGPHEIVFRYEPMAFYAGTCMCALTVFAISAYAFFFGHRRFPDRKIPD